MRLGHTDTQIYRPPNLSRVRCCEFVVVESASESASNMEGPYTLFGYPVPFPTKDLYIAVAAVALFLPATVCAHRLVSAILGLFLKNRAAQNEKHD